MMFNLRTLGALPLVALLAACGNDPEAFSAAMPPVTLADHSVQQTAVGQVSNGDCGETATQLTTYHMKRGSHALKPVASGTVVTENGCAVIVGAVAAVAAAKVGAGDVISNANAGSVSISEAEANVKTGGGKPNY
jgi:hypothetical protein